MLKCNKIIEKITFKYDKIIEKFLAFKKCMKIIEKKRRIDVLNF